MQDLDTMTNVILNNEYKLHEEEQKTNFESGNNGNNNQNNNSNKTKKRRKKKKTLKQKLLLVLKIIIGLIILFVLFIFLFFKTSLFQKYKELWVETAMSTMNHQYLATWFYDDDTINAVLDKNKVKEVNEVTDTNTIVINKTATQKEYENEYEREILERDANADYKIINIKGKGYSGYLAAIYEPSRIKTVYTKKLGTSGQYLTQMAKDNDALIAINGGGFEDPNFNSNGANPLGITYSGGKLITSKTWNGSGGLIGFTQDDKLVLGKMTVKQSQEMKIRDGVTFGPFLIINGKASKVLGNGGWGTAPRTAIGQRKDGIVLFLVVDGRTLKEPGADMNDLIEIMERYGAYNAANLDGGTSSVMVVDGKIINDPVDSSGAHRTRFISTGFILTKK